MGPAKVAKKVSPAKVAKKASPAKVAKKVSPAKVAKKASPVKKLVGPCTGHSSTDCKKPCTWVKARSGKSPKTGKSFTVKAHCGFDPSTVKQDYTKETSTMKAHRAKLGLETPVLKASVKSVKAAKSPKKTKN